jgi:hypothetical protein
LLFWISARVLDLSALPHGATIWPILTAQINAALKAIGLSLQLWYVLTALVIAYLAAFEGVRSLLSSLPILRVRYVIRYKPESLAYAAMVLQARPDAWKINERLNDLVDQYGQELKEKNQPHPYQWQFDRERRYISYYGTLLVALGACIAWAASGGAMARSPGAVWRLAGLIALAAVVVRWTSQVLDSGESQSGADFECQDRPLA